MIPPQEALSPVARKRLAAIKEFSDLGSGFRVAALDLEIRGAGNLLGGEQSGHIDAVGFEMYTKLLEETIRELRGEEIEDDARATVNLRVDLKIDEDYIQDMNQRLMVYRKVASARTRQELDATLEGIRDRYGPPPSSVLNLAEYGRVRILADAIDIESIDREGRMVVIRFRPNARLDPMRLVKVVGGWPGATLVPPVSVKLDVEAPTRGDSAAASAGDRHREPAVKADRAAVATDTRRELVDRSGRPPAKCGRDSRRKRSCESPKATPARRVGCSLGSSGCFRPWGPTGSPFRPPERQVRY